MIEKFKLTIAGATLLLITACGGGSEVVGNTEYKKSVGDYFTYFYTTTSNSNTTIGYFFTRNYTQVSSDQSWVSDQTYSVNTFKNKWIPIEEAENNKIDIINNEKRLKITEQIIETNDNEYIKKYSN